ncbi:MAG: hypothetical protein R3C24_08705 [Cyanobacteriota/Melainabacteria group bacterium]
MTSKIPRILLGSIAMAVIFVQGLAANAESSLKDEFASQANKYEKLLQEKRRHGTRSDVDRRRHAHN